MKPSKPISKSIIGTVLLTITFSVATIEFTNAQALTPQKNENSGKWGFVDTSNAVIIDHVFDRVIIPFDEDEAAVVEFNGGTYIINQRGTLVKSVNEYEQISRKNGYPTKSLSVAERDGLFGVIDIVGEVILPCIKENSNISIDELNTIKARIKEKTIDEDYDIFKVDVEAIGKSYIAKRELEEFEKNRYTNFEKKYVAEKYAEWQKRGNFETQKDYTKRISEDRSKVEKRLKLEAQQEYIKLHTPTDFSNFKLGVYDADQEVFVIKTNGLNTLLLSVPDRWDTAKEFEAGWDKVVISDAEYFIDTKRDLIGISKMLFTVPKSEEAPMMAYLYNERTARKYKMPQEEIENTQTQPTTSGEKTDYTENVEMVSAVDIDIPDTRIRNTNTYVLIISNEKYQKITNVSFAIKDGDTFRKYCRKTLGVPEENIRFYSDATRNNMISGVNWLRNVLDAYNGEAKAIVYYAGHGVPDLKNETSYLLPVDGDINDIETAYALDDMYQELGSQPAKSVTYFLDACFSGAKRDGELLSSNVRGVVIKPKAGKLSGNSVVFSACQGKEFAHEYAQEGHGMFTYFLLKTLQKSRGNISYDKLAEEVKSGVRQTLANMEESKRQTPIVQASMDVNETWKQWNFAR
jgi:hypothetical protein